MGDTPGNHRLDAVVSPAKGAQHISMRRLAAYPRRLQQKLGCARAMAKAKLALASGAAETYIARSF